MNDRDQRRYDRALRVQTFGQENAADFAPGGTARALFADLDHIIVRLNLAKADQTPTRVSKETLLDALAEDFTNLSRTARAIALRDPGFAAPYNVPDNTSESARLTHADSLLTRLEDQPGDSPETLAGKASLRAKFVAYELPVDFVEDLRADLDALRATGARNRGETQDGVENTAAIGRLLSEAAEVVQNLDALVHNKYARQPERLRAWQSASRTERSPQRKKAGPTPGATPPAGGV